MKWPWHKPPRPEVPDRRGQAEHALNVSRAQLDDARRTRARIGAITGVLLREAEVNHFTERWQREMHPRKGTA